MAKPPALDLTEITALGQAFRVTIPPEYQDENRHMNIRHYMTIFDDAGYPLIERFGLTLDYHRAHQTGGFDLEHHINYLNEVHVGDVVAVYTRLVNRTAKRIHYLMFMVNETRGNVAALFECVNAFADLSIRKTAPYPPEIAAQIDRILFEHQALVWPAPVCGVMQA